MLAFLRLFGWRPRFFPPSGIRAQRPGTLFRRCIETWIAS
jgi:hypothetical protein